MTQMPRSRWSRLIAFCIGPLALAGCQQNPGSAASENATAQQISQRAKDIEAAADAAVNQQIDEINAAASEIQDAPR